MCFMIKCQMIQNSTTTIIVTIKQFKINKILNNNKTYVAARSATLLDQAPGVVKETNVDTDDGVLAMICFLSWNKKKNILKKQSQHLK